DRVLEEWSNALARRGRFYLEYRIVSREGDLLWFHDEAAPLGEEDEDTPLYQGVLIDVSAQKRTEEALRDSEERFRQLAEHIQDVFWNKDVGRPGLLYI